MRKFSFYVSSLVLLLALSAFVSFATPANAHDPPLSIPTHAYVGISPDTVQVNQYTQVLMWLDWVPPTAGGEGGDRWHNMTLEITKPDGSEETLGPFTSGPVGSTYTLFTPDQVGEYTIVLNFAGQVATNGTGTPNFRGLAFVGDYFEPSTSDPVILHVQEEPIAGWVEPPLPTGYWTRPINDANRDWSVLASNWLGGSWLVYNFQNAGMAPESPHIVWTKQITEGGIADAQWPGIPYDINDYESPWSTPIIMNGRIYYNSPQTAAGPRYGYYCIDLQTGEQIWYKNGTDNGLDNPVNYVGFASGANTAPELQQNFPSLSFGQIYHYASLNGDGIISYLWMTVGSTWYLLDSDSGNWIMTLVNVPGGTTVTDQDGSILRYSYNRQTGNVLCWNTSQAIPPSGPTGTGQQIWKPRVGAVIDAVNDTTWTEFGPREGQWDESDIQPRSGYTMNVTAPSGLVGLSRVLTDSNRVPKLLMGFSVSPPIATSGLSLPTETFTAWVMRIDEHVVPYSPYPDKTYTQNNNLGFGLTLLWNKTIANPSNGTSISLGTTSYEDGIFTIDVKETRERYAYNLETGDFMWGPTEALPAWNVYGQSDNVAYGQIYATGYGGVVNCIDTQTGDLVWNYTASGIGYESPYGNYPLSIGAIADGKLYLYSTEHSPTKPLWRGSYIRCLNITDGEELWRLLTYNMGLAIADGYLVAGDQYDNTIVTIGKGQTKVTVTTQETTAPLNTAVLISGTVTDQSPGAPGTPAISDDWMQPWMEYIYKQQSKPNEATGVPIHLTAIDPNGNTQDIATVTSDIDGMFMTTWTPPVEGAYKIIASFDGSRSYYPSQGFSALGIGPAQAAPSVSPSTPTPSTPTTPTPSSTLPPDVTPTPVISPSPSTVPPPTSDVPTTTYIAIAAVVIIIVAVAAFFALRRRQ